MLRWHLCSMAFTAEATMNLETLLEQLLSALEADEDTSLIEAQIERFYQTLQ